MRQVVFRKRGESSNLGGGNSCVIYSSASQIDSTLLCHLRFRSNREVFQHQDLLQSWGGAQPRGHVDEDAGSLISLISLVHYFNPMIINICCCAVALLSHRALENVDNFLKISKYFTVFKKKIGSFSANYSLINFNSSCLILFREADRNYFKVKWFNSDYCNATVQYYNI